MKITFGMAAIVMMATVATMPIAAPAAIDGPMGMMRSLGDQILATLRDPSCTAKQAACQQRLRGLVEAHWDRNEMSRSALGVHWKELTPEQRTQFIELFSELLENLYISRANLSEAQKTKTIQVNYLKEISQGDGYSQVNTTVVLSGADQPVEVNYRLKREGSNWKVYDIVVAGISLVGNYRNQFSRIINRDGYPALIKDLQTKIAQLHSPT